ncbi:MAG: L,D-transpeptidase family protein [Phycisphaerae bacterium]|nr:L,D-transpeptidase family protein [Phycisphaerae bacterium]
MLSYRRRKIRRRRIAVAGIVLVVVAVTGWWYFRPRGEQVGLENAGSVVQAASSETYPLADEVSQGAGEQGVEPGSSATIPDAERPAAVTLEDTPAASEDPAAARASNDTRTGNAAIEAARRDYKAGKVLEARRQLTTLLKRKLTGAEDSEVRALLTRIAKETLFSKQSVSNDPLVGSHTVQTGEYLTSIGKKYDVPPEILAAINSVHPNRIRAGQKLKVIRGPFHATIHKSKFRLDIYLGNLYVRSYRVGLGKENGTPEGVWKVKDRLSNPRYYPPASAVEKRIIEPDDPHNPLGEHWISLEGVEGDAVGREGYGIHGTIEPESIGKAVSLGCVRMHNEEVTFLYSVLLPGRSTVTIRP